MTDISPKSLRMLKKIKKLDYIPEDKIPLNFDRYRLQFLVDHNLVEKFTLIPAGYEGYVRGLSAYRLTPEGEDSMYYFRKLAFEARVALILSVLALLNSLHGEFAPHLNTDNTYNSETPTAMAETVPVRYGYMHWSGT